jgi:hypothetical protein
MAILKIRAFDSSVPGGSGISLSLGEIKAGQFFKVGISAAAQTKYFGGALDPAKDAISLAIDDAAGKNHLLKIELCDADSPDAVPLTKNAHGSVSAKIGPWCQVAPGKRPPVQMLVATAGRVGDVVLKMPEWARPEARKIGQGKSLMEC